MSFRRGGYKRGRSAAPYKKYAKRGYTKKATSKSYKPRSRVLSSVSKRATKKIEVKMLDMFVGAIAIPATGVNGGIPAAAFMYPIRVGTPGSAAPVVPCTGSPYPAFNSVAPGSSGYQREGRKISLRHVNVEYCISWPAVSVAYNDVSIILSRIFVALVLDTQCNGTYPGGTTANPSDIFSSGFLGDGSSAYFSALPLINMNTVNRYKVLGLKYYEWDPKYFYSNAAPSNYVAASPQYGSMSASLSGVTTTFRSDVNATAAASIGDIADNSLLVMCWAGAVGSVVPTFQCASRLTYTG